MGGWVWGNDDVMFKVGIGNDDKVGGWVKKGQNHDDIILEWSLTKCSSKTILCFVTFLWKSLW